jgi:hypothetical protein
MRVALAVGGLALGTLFGSAVAQATTATIYDLGTDLYTSGSPWSITYNGGTALPHQGSAVNNNHLYPAIPSDGFYGLGTDLNDSASTPFVFRAAVDGHLATGPGGALSDDDFLAGDVLVHTPNADNSDVTITWTAPSAGTIDSFDLALWYAHSTVDRSNDVTFDYDGNPGAPFTWVTSVALNSGRDPLTQGSLTGGGIVVAAGDLMTLTLAKTSGIYGSLTGLNWAIEFTASAVTPIPAALPLFVSALAGLGFLARRRRQAAS